MSIHEYARSLAPTATISKHQLFCFLETHFARADSNHDGTLDYEELDLFVRAVSHPESDQR